MLVFCGLFPPPLDHPVPFVCFLAENRDWSVMVCCFFCSFHFGIHTASTPITAATHTDAGAVIR